MKKGRKLDHALLSAGAGLAGWLPALGCGSGGCAACGGCWGGGLTLALVLILAAKLRNRPERGISNGMAENGY